MADVEAGRQVPLGEGPSPDTRAGRGRFWPAGAPAPAFTDAVQGARGWGLRPADVLFAALVLAAALALCCVLWFACGLRGLPGIPTGDDGPSDAAVASGETLYAVVQNAEGFYRVLPLNEDATLVVAGSLGSNTVEVEAGCVRCAESDCANQVCVDAGWVGSAGQMIVCLPHKLTVQVVADPADASSLS